ncbi:metal-binding protein, partial [Streptomyces sp. YC419]|nr:metal-binding protein [Streptomyces ureilyticus]
MTTDGIQASYVVTPSDRPDRNLTKDRVRAAQDAPWHQVRLLLRLHRYA